jgi:hypothetical protein
MSEAWVIIRADFCNMENNSGQAKTEKIAAIRHSRDEVDAWLAKHPLTQRWGWDGKLYPSYRLERHSTVDFTPASIGATISIHNHSEHSTDV